MSDDNFELIDLTFPSPLTMNSSPLPTSSPSTITAAVSPDGKYFLCCSFISCFITVHVFCPDDIRRRFSPAEIFLFEDKYISQWFKAFIAIRRLCLLDENVLPLVK